MNPAANTATSGGVAGAAVVLISGTLGFFHITITPEYAAALMTLITAGVGYFLHTRNKT